MPKFSSYEQAESWLLSITDYERLLGKENLTYNTHTFDLDRFRQQLRQIGDPQKQYAVFHIAGTKGKGSTCAFLESALRHCGYRTGLYTSPHLYRFTERIRVDGEEIPDDQFCRLMEKMGREIMKADCSSVDQGQNSFRTVFEILTAAAFQHFADKQIDVAIIETGLGGRLDSTNVFDEQGAGPLINVLTAIGLDHTSILGNTLEAIASEKAGIIRKHAHTILATQVSEEYETIVRDVIIDRQHQINSERPFIASKDCLNVSDCGQDTGSVMFQVDSNNASASSLSRALKQGMTARPSLEGGHQVNNAGTAILALREFEAALSSGKWPQRSAGESWPTLDPVKIVEGLQHTSWPGRFTVIESDVPVVIDGAHCVISAAALANTCKARYGNKPAVLVSGFLRDKAGEDMLRVIGERVPVTAAIALPPPSPRALPADHIVDAMQKVFGADKVKSAPSVEAALGTAREIAKAVDGYVVVFGSLYLVGPAIDALK